MGGLPVKSWMKVETYGQTCLNLRPEAGDLQTVGSLLIANMFLEPVGSGFVRSSGTFPEMAWPLRVFIAFF